MPRMNSNQFIININQSILRKKLENILPFSLWDWNYKIFTFVVSTGSMPNPWRVIVIIIIIEDLKNIRFEKFNSYVVSLHFTPFQANCAMKQFEWSIPQSYMGIMLISHNMVSFKMVFNKFSRIGYLAGTY